MSASAFAEALAAAVTRQDGAACARLLRLGDDEGDDAVRGGRKGGRAAAARLRGCADAAALRTAAEETAAAAEREAGAAGLADDFSPICGLHVAVVAALVAAHEEEPGAARRRLLEAAFKCQTQAFKKFTEAFRSHGSWLVPVVMTLVHDTRVLAVWTDREVGANHVENLRETKSLLENCFRQAIIGRATTEDAQRKRMVGLYIVNHQFKVFFALKSLGLCRNLVASVENKTFPDLESFPMDQQVMYKYYHGRLLILDDRIAKARETLQFAFDNCPAELRRNRRLILEYLVPISLFCGRAPTNALLEEYDIGYLADLIRHVQNGDVRALSTLIDDQQDQFIARGLFLALDQLKVIAYRNLFRNIVLLYQGQVADDRNKTRVPIGLFVRPFEVYREPDPLAQLMNADTADSGESADIALMEHTKCILSNLIFQRFVKGYISHEKATLVLSPTEPFPKLQAIYPLHPSEAT